MRALLKDRIALNAALTLCVGQFRNLVAEFLVHIMCCAHIKDSLGPKYSVPQMMNALGRKNLSLYLRCLRCHNNAMFSFDWEIQGDAKTHFCSVTLKNACAFTIVLGSVSLFYVPCSA